MPYIPAPFNYYGNEENQVLNDLERANNNFTILSQLCVNNDPTTGRVKDADKVDGFHASQNPTPNAIPVANSDGKIDVNWLPPSVASLPYETYSRMYVGDEMPTNLQHGDLVYVRTQNRLYRYDKRTGQLIEVDWKTIVESSPEWKSGRLRVNSTTGRLEISPNGTNWYECIPAVGSQAIELANIDNTSYSLLYWIAPGQSAVVRQANHLPLTFILGNIYDVKIRFSVPNDVGAFFLRIGNVSSPAHYTDISVTDVTQSETGNPIGRGLFTYPAHRIAGPGRHSYSMFTISAYPDIFTSVGVFQLPWTTYGFIGFSNYSQYTSSVYWLGVTTNETSGFPPQTFQIATIARRL